MRLLVIGLLVAAAVQGQPEAPVPETNPHTTSTDVEQGRRLFDGRCAGCHGKGGTQAIGQSAWIGMWGR